MEKVMKKQYKVILNADIKTHETGDNVTGDNIITISGYANTKNKADAFGHIPTSYKGKPVYDLNEYKKNYFLVIVERLKFC